MSAPVGPAREQHPASAAAFAPIRDVGSRAALARARNHYLNGDYQDAIDALNELTSTSSNVAGTTLPDAARLRAGAAALEVRALLHLERPVDAHERSVDTVRQFDALIAAGLRPSAEEHKDFGIALYVCGERDIEARSELELAIAAGVGHAETYRFLGLTLMRLELFAAAADALKTSLTLEPDSLPTISVLVECLDREEFPLADRAAVYLDQAVASFAAGRLEDAERACRRSVELAETSRGVAGLGLILVSRNHFEEGLTVLDRALVLDPSDSWSLFRKGETLRHLGRTPEALDVLARIPDTSDAYVPAQASRAAALNGLGQFQESVAVIDTALVRQPEYGFALAVKAEALEALGQRDEAIELYRRATTADPTLTFAEYQLVELLRTTEQYEEAVAVADKVLAKDPSLVSVLASKGAALVGLGKPEDAIPFLDQALAGNPDYGFALAQKAQALIALERRDDVVPVLRRLGTIEPDAIGVQFELAESLRLTGQYEESMKELQDLLERSPDNAVAIGTIGQILASRGQEDKAEIELSKAVSLDPSLHWAWMSLAECLRIAGKNVEALAAFDKVLASEPTHVYALAWKGDTLLALERYDEALTALDQAIALDSRHAFSIATKGQVFARQSRLDEARELLEQAIAIDKEDAQQEARAFALSWAQFELAETLRILGRLPEAVEAYDELLEQEPEYVEVLGGRGAVLFGLERYDDALSSLDRALVLEPDYTFGLGIKGALLASCGEYGAASDLLARATASADAAQYFVMASGFALRCLRRFSEAETALRRAIQLDASDRAAQYNLADVYRLTGRLDLANDIYREITKDWPTENLDANDESIVGWSFYGLAEYDRAVQCLTDAVSRGTLMAHAQLDLGLVLICSGRVELAAREYERAVDMATAEHHPWRRRGLFSMALEDIADARTEHPQLFAAELVLSIERRLRRELERTPAVAMGTAAGDGPEREDSARP